MLNNYFQVKQTFLELILRSYWFVVNTLVNANNEVFAEATLQYTTKFYHGVHGPLEDG